MVNIKIEGVSYQVEAGLTILEAARKCGYEIPSLCAFNHGECSNGSCRVCLVEVKGARGLVASCVYPVNEGMEIIISSPKAVEARRASVELLLSNHNINCQQCDKNGKCELLHVAAVTGAREGRYMGSKTPVTVDALTPAIIRDTSKCILCGRCVARCQNAHGMGILGFENRGFHTIVAPAENRSFRNSPCIQCGQCVSVCPTGALMEKSEIAKVDAAFKAGKHVVVQTAPAVRAALGEEFGMPIGTPVTGKMVAALKRLGFHKVYDTNFAADLTIMEEGTELLGRIQNGGKLPMITSCSPGWINYAEYNYGDLLGLGEVMVRKDLAKISETGRRRTGRSRERLIRDIEEYLALTAETPTVIVGAGKLGRALLDYDGFDASGFQILAAFDLEPDSAEQKNEKPIYPMSRLQNFYRYYHVRIGIITLKYTQSNSVCFAYDGQAIGVGAGQQSRIHCTRLAGSKADTWFLRQHPKTLGLKFRSDLGRANRDNVIDGYVNGNEEDVCADGIWQNYFTEQPERLTEGDKKA